MSGPRPPLVLRRRRGRWAVVLVVAAAGLVGGPAAALVPVLSPAEIQEAVAEGTRSLGRDDFGEEWRVQLPGGEEIVVTTPFSRLALAARQAAFKEQPLTERQVQEQVERGKGKLQVLVATFGRQVDFARWYQAVLRVDDREVRATFTQNERTALRLEDGRFLARNLYVFPLEGLPVRGTVTLVVRHGLERTEVLRATLDLGRMR